MSHTHLAIVWNPSKTDAETLETAVNAAIENHTSETGVAVEVSWFETSVDDPGRAAAREAVATGATVIAAAGGDGTVRAVAEELADSGASVDLAVIPLGTGNLLARNLDVPLNDLQSAFTRALSGVAEPIDIGWADVTLSSGARRVAFAVMAGFGIDAHMITETHDDLKDRAGWLAYVESMGRAVAASEVLSIELSFDDGAQQAIEAHTVLVGNCGMLQGGITLLPDADPRDGQLDSLVLSAEGLGGWLDTARNLVWENGVKRLLGQSDGATSTASTLHRQLRSLNVSLPEPRMFEVDGDDLGEARSFVFSVQPAALRVR